VRCPTCKTECDPGRSAFAPFCSERCKLLDLSRWLEGEFCIPGAPVEFPEAKDIGNKEHDEEPDD